MTCFSAVSNFRQSIFISAIVIIPPAAAFLGSNEPLQIVSCGFIFHCFNSFYSSPLGLSPIYVKSTQKVNLP